MQLTKLVLERVEVRPVLVPLERPVVSRVGLYEEWPLILIDLYTDEGIVGRSYLAPYLKQAVRYIVPAIEDLAAARQGKPIAPLDDFAAGRKALGLVGLEGVSLIAVSGLDMAAWDALAKAAEVPLAVHLGGSLAPVPAYNSNGLWLTPLDALAKEAEELVAEGGFAGLKLRLGRERIEDDLAAIRLVREVLGPDGHIMSDFNQGLVAGRCAAPLPRPRRPGPLLVRGADRVRRPRRLRPAHARARDAGDARRELLRAALAACRDPGGRRRLRHAGSDADRRGHRLAARRCHRRRRRHPDVLAPLPRALEPSAARGRDRRTGWNGRTGRIPSSRSRSRVENGHLLIRDVPGAGLEWDEAAVQRYRMG